MWTEQSCSTARRVEHVMLSGPFLLAPLTSFSLRSVAVGHMLNEKSPSRLVFGGLRKRRLPIYSVLFKSKHAITGSNTYRASKSWL